MNWQRCTRIGLVIFGAAVATVVYFSIGERRAPTAPVRVPRDDPNSQVEVRAG